jgi:hypothetical protein
MTLHADSGRAAGLSPDRSQAEPRIGFAKVVAVLSMRNLPRPERACRLSHRNGPAERREA